MEAKLRKTTTTTNLRSRLTGFEKNIWIVILSGLHNLECRTRRLIFWLTHRQQHALDLADRSETPEKREQAHQQWGDDQHVNSAGEQVRAQQLVQEVSIRKRDHAQHENDRATDLS